MIHIVRMKMLWIELDIIKGLHTFFGRLCRKLWAKRNKICLKIWESLSRENETPIKIYIDEFIGEQSIDEIKQLTKEFKEK